MWRAMELTVNIMKELSITPSHWNVKRSYAEVAKKLGVDEDTVRNRVQSLRESGFLLGWRLILNANLLGMQSWIVPIELDRQEGKDRVIDQVSKMEGVVLVQSFYGKALQVTIFCKNEEHARQLIDGMLSIGAKVITCWNVKLRKVSYRPKQLDWLIIGSLLKDADKKISDIAEELNVSSRTVKRKTTLMLESSAFFLQPVLDLKKVAGALPCHLLVECSEAAKPGIDEFIASKFERVVFSLTDSDTHSIFTIICMNLAEAQSIARQVQGQPGVMMAKIEIIEGLVYADSWLAKEIRMRSVE